MSQVSAMKSKYPSRTTTRTSPRVSFTYNTVQNTPNQSSSIFNISNPRIDSPQVLSFDKVGEKLFSKNLIAAHKSKDAVLKEFRDCIIQSEKERLKQLNQHLQRYWCDLYASSFCVCMDEKVENPNALKEELKEDLHASHRAAGEWYVWTNTVSDHTWTGICFFVQ